MCNFERFLYEDGFVLRNLPGIEDIEDFNCALDDYSAMRIDSLDQADIDLTFDRAHLAALHAYIFQDIFEWAGSMRDETVEIEGDVIGPVSTMSKPDGEEFDDEQVLEIGFKTLRDLIETHRPGDDIVEHLACLLTHINWMHPFREGNGRVQRVFITQYALTKGYVLNFGQADKKDIYAASKNSTREDWSATTHLLSTILPKPS